MLSAIFDVDGSGVGSQMDFDFVKIERSPPTNSGNNYRRTKSDMNLMFETQGTIPYLGTFITEFQMLDNKFPNLTPGTF